MVSCIIPFYNEGNRILNVLKEITKCKNIKQIICVDDGSSDKSYEKVKVKYPKVKLVRLNKNTGKSNAVRQGLKHIKTEYVFLLDADLFDVNSKEVDTIISKFIKHKPGLLIFRTEKDTFYAKIMRGVIVLSGVRILSKKDLLGAFKLNPRNFQLEVCINKYMINNNKQVAWIKSSIGNIPQFNKYDFFYGWKRECKMGVEIATFYGPQTFLSQMLFFCRKELK